MTEPKTIPDTFDDGSPCVRLWPTGNRWTSATFLKQIDRIAYTIHLWRVEIDSFIPGETNVFTQAVVWPKVWHKVTPAYMAWAINKQGAKSREFELIADVDRDMQAAMAGELPPGIADADVIVDTRDLPPNANGQQN